MRKAVFVLSVIGLVLLVTATASGRVQRLITGLDIQNGSIKSIDIAKHTIVRANLNNKLVSSLRGQRGLRGLRGVTGAKGAAGDTGATGAAGATGATGATGASGAAGASALSPVPTGQTIRGVVGADYHAFDNSASDFGVDATLPIPAPVALADSDVFVNIAGWQNAGGQTAPTTTDTNVGCNGTPANPTAPAGKVCIYVAGADHAFNLAGYSVLFGTEASKYGFKLKWDASQSGDTFVDATWAYTAP